MTEPNNSAPAHRPGLAAFVSLFPGIASPAIEAQAAWERQIIRARTLSLATAEEIAVMVKGLAGAWGVDPWAAITQLNDDLVAGRIVIQRGPSIAAHVVAMPSLRANDLNEYAGIARARRLYPTPEIAEASDRMEAQEAAINRQLVAGWAPSPDQVADLMGISPRQPAAVMPADAGADQAMVKASARSREDQRQAFNARVRKRRASQKAKTKQRQYGSRGR